MINNIFYNNQQVVDTERKGKFSFFILANGDRIKSKVLTGAQIEIQCHECEQLSNIKFYQGKNGLLKRRYLCRSCVGKGEKNGFYGQKHSEEFKKRLSAERKGKWMLGESNPMFGKNTWSMLDEATREKKRVKLSSASSGENNPFYGKKHSKKSIEKICKANKQTKDSWTEKQKKDFSAKCAMAQKKIMKSNPDKYSQDRRRAALVAARSRQKYKINKIERIVQGELSKRGLNFKYSIILGYKQFDFGNKECRILLEVQGDYWHANPKKYGEGCGNRQINAIQKIKIEQDKEKIKFAQKNDFKLFHIWEYDINNKDFHILNKIEEYINGIDKI